MILGLTSLSRNLELLRAGCILLASSASACSATSSKTNQEAECVEGDRCSEEQCSDTGSCIADSDHSDDSDAPQIALDGQGGATEATGGRASLPDVCIDVDVDFEAVVPQVWLVLDLSGSMNDDINGNSNPADGESRWEIVGDVLFGDAASATDGVVGELESVVQFGAKIYEGNHHNENACEVRLVEVDVSLDNSSSIEAAFNAEFPIDGRTTPTAHAIDATTATALAAEPTNGPQLIILATDGEPQCNDATNETFEGVEDSVEAAANQGVSTALVFIGAAKDGDHEEHLQNVANLGVGLGRDTTTPAVYYEANQKDELLSSFQAILNDARSCLVELDGNVDRTHESLGTVTLSGVSIPYGTEDGWEMQSESMLGLLGEACDALKQGDQTLEIDFPCDVYTPLVVR